jgi:transcriptional regulator with XRE-family HTH domain
MTGSVGADLAPIRDPDPAARLAKTGHRILVMAYDAETIKRARKLAGLTQEEFGLRVGSPRSVNRWESQGISDRSPHIERLEQVLHLSDPAVLRAIREIDLPPEEQSQPTDDFGDDPRELGNAALLARLDADLAELKRRFAELSNPLPRRRLYGQTLPYPAHLDGHATSHDGEGSSHNRAGSST